ncbi:hypothetical protein [Salinibacter sp.]|uniref:hypothetical protein n=1 Tax=Salinibacter sp. TaxID=2065818 RepID=UPI0021E768F8|nr:hypothetical protein [Salinibacter sp.]
MTKYKIYSAIIAAASILSFSSCSDGIESYNLNAPSPLEVLEKDIENVRKKMSKARLVYSGKEYAKRFAKVEKEIEWEYIPKTTYSNEVKSAISDMEIDVDEIRSSSEEAFSKVSLTVRVDRNGEVVQAQEKMIFKDVEVFRKYYPLRLRLADLIIGTDSETISCFEIRVPLLPGEEKEADQFNLKKEELHDWENTKRCERAAWKGKNWTGEGKTVIFALSLNIQRDPEERTKESERDRYVIESAKLKGYM